MAGTIALAFTIPPDPLTGLSMPGCKLDVFQEGTLVRVNTWQNLGLTTSASNPIVADGVGRLPMFYVAETTVTAQLTDADGVVKESVVLPVVGPTAASVPAPAVVIPTGMILLADSTAAITGFVRLNGRTIGSAASGATERANADVAALYDWKWTRQDNTQAPVAGGRGASAAADFAANKLMTMFSPEGHALAISDDMGAGLRGVIPAGFVTVGSAGTIGSKFGTMNRTFLRANLPAENLSHTLSLSSNSISNGTLVARSFSKSTGSNLTGGGGGSYVSDVNWSSDTLSLANTNLSGSVPLGGSGTSFGIAQASFTLGLFQKL